MVDPLDRPSISSASGSHARRDRLDRLDEIADILALFGVPVRPASGELWQAITVAEAAIAQRREDERWEALARARARAGETLSKRGIWLTHDALAEALRALWHADALIAERDGERAEAFVARVEAELEGAIPGSTEAPEKAPTKTPAADAPLASLIGRAQAAHQAAQVSGNPWAFCLEESLQRARAASAPGTDARRRRSWEGALESLTTAMSPPESKALPAIVAAIDAAERELAAFPDADRTPASAQLERARRALPSSASLASAAGTGALDHAVVTICAVRRLLTERARRDAERLGPQVSELERQLAAAAGPSLVELTAARRVLVEAHEAIDAGLVLPARLGDRLREVSTALQQAEKLIRNREAALRKAALDALARLERLGISGKELGIDAATVGGATGAPLSRIHRELYSRLGAAEGVLRRRAVEVRTRAEAWMGQQLRAPDAGVETMFRDAGRALKVLDRALAGPEGRDVRQATRVVEQLVGEPGSIAP